MVKLSASVSKKVPMPDVEFSSRCCSAGIEVELATPSDSKEILSRLKQLYATLEVAVDEQLSAPRNAPALNGEPEHTPNSPRAPKPRRNGNGNGKGRPATDAQVRAIEAIARDRGVADSELTGILIDRFGAGEVTALTIREASTMIDELKGGNGREA
jgi:hypothetical protein